MYEIDTHRNLKRSEREENVGVLKCGLKSKNFFQQKQQQLLKTRFLMGVRMGAVQNTFIML